MRKVQIKQWQIHRIVKAIVVSMALVSVGAVMRGQYDARFVKKTIRAEVEGLKCPVLQRAFYSPRGDDELWAIVEMEKYALIENLKTELPSHFQFGWAYYGRQGCSAVFESTKEDYTIEIDIEQSSSSHTRILLWRTPSVD